MGVILCGIVIQNRGADEGVKALKLEADGGCERWSMTLESCEIGMLSGGNVN
ncbi:MAG: hypothetical protein IJW42_05390 [Alistipes sp.]|nr:hypothetical protein [Alistipes sp.]